MAEPVRVQKVIAAAGLMSRRKADIAIARGRVLIEDRVAELGDRVDIAKEKVRVDGALVPVHPDLETHLLYKPAGVVSTASDPHGRPTVVELVPSEKRLYPVGRLDIESEGLILVSNDGELTNLITHPRYGITKVYTVLVRGAIGKRELRRLHEGVELDDGPARAIAAKIVDSGPDRTLIELTMGEGRNREIRRMMAALGRDVVRLVRTAIGPLSDRALQSGSSRRLEPSEVHSLHLAAKDRADR